MRAASLWLAAVGLVSSFGCQAISGLDGLWLTGSDASTAPADAGPCEGELADSAVCRDARCDAGACGCRLGTAADSCEPVEQCGCAPETHCQLRDGIASCVPSGPTGLGGTCNADGECAAGMGCMGGLCTRYCGRDRDCDAGKCRTFTVVAGVSTKGCVRECDFETQAPCGEGAQCARVEDAADLRAGDYCVVPSATCDNDGRCDEPAWGTRRCVAGSDTRDCACAPSSLEASCDLVSQCGCSPGMHCALLDADSSTVRVGCMTDLASSRDPGATCNAEAECPTGYSCWRGLCEKYCSRDADCGAGRCIAIRGPNEVQGVRLCSVTCDFASNTGCAEGQACVQAPDNLAYCWVPRSPCLFAADGTCDEPEGTRICEEETDAADCP